MPTFRILGARWFIPRQASRRHYMIIGESGSGVTWIGLGSTVILPLSTTFAVEPGLTMNDSQIIPGKARLYPRANHCGGPVRTEMTPESFP